jgi:hypothetical protein
MKRNKITLAMIAILLSLLVLMGPISRCNLLDGDDGDGYDPFALLALLFFLNQGGTPSDGFTVTDTIPTLNAWKYYTLDAQNDGFFNVTLTDGDGAGADDPDLYLSYLGVTTNPTVTTCTGDWVACDLSANTTATLSNYFVGNSLSRKIGVYTQTGTNVAYTLAATRVGAMPQGCDYTFENSTPLTIGGATFSDSINVPAPGNRDFYFVILNNSATNAKNHTIRLTFSGLSVGDTINTRTYAAADVNLCTNIELGSSFTNCAASPCDRTYTLNGGDFLLYSVSLIDAGGGGLTVNYTLQVLP